MNERKLYTTSLGEEVNNILKKYFKDIIDVKFTALMEEELDRIATGETEYEKVIHEFYIPFE